MLLLPAGIAAAEDFKLSDGTILRGARVLEVRPDALVVAHDKGVALADLEKLPREIRARYGYDPRKAAAYREHDATARRTTAAENRRLIAAHEERKQALARAQWEADTAQASSASSGEIRFSSRESAADRGLLPGCGLRSAGRSPGRAGLHCRQRTHDLLDRALLEASHRPGARLHSRREAACEGSAARRPRRKYGTRNWR